jgi:hypothetical protein
MEIAIGNLCFGDSKKERPNLNNQDRARGISNVLKRWRNRRAANTFERRSLLRKPNGATACIVAKSGLSTHKRKRYIRDEGGKKRDVRTYRRLSTSLLKDL